MYRVIAIVCGGLALVACSSTPDWLSSNALKPQPILDTVRLEIDAAGCRSQDFQLGQTRLTPCALALPTETQLTVTFTLNGYLPDTESLDPISLTGTETNEAFSP